MRQERQRLKQAAYSVIIALVALLMVFSMLLWPRETYEGARYGLEIWATILVPSLLPFFILAEIILDLGLVHMLGVLLEPVMRPLFNLPGSASFVAAMGFTSGFPMGAVITRRLYEEKLCTHSEGERLVAFTNNSSPLFILVGVGVGMFHDSRLGFVLMISHYLSNIFLGIFLGLFSLRTQKFQYSRENIIIKSIKTLLSAQKNRKPLGILMADAIKKGSLSITLIGGFVLVYAIIIRLLEASGLLSMLGKFFAAILFFFARDLSTIGKSLSTGFWEITLGLKEMSQLPLPFWVKAVGASLLLGWSGLCIQSQVISVLAGSGLKTHLYFRGRVFQSLLAAFLSFLLCQTLDYWGNMISIPAARIPVEQGFFPQLLFGVSYTLSACKIIFWGFLALCGWFLLFQALKRFLRWFMAQF